MPESRHRTIGVFWRSITVPLFALVCGPLVTRCLANHGPGASGGGSSTLSGETLKQGSVELSLREDYSQFESFNKTQAAQRASAADSFDALNHGFLTTAEVAYGLSDDLQLSASVGYFIGRDFISADRDPSSGSIDLASAQPNGLTDLLLTAKYRLLSGAPGNLSILGGLKLPSGRDDVHLSNGERLSPTDQPGTGAWDFPVGLAYSRFLTSHLTLDASAVYTLRTQHDGFRVGNRLDTGLALAYRLTDSIKTFPQYSIFVELNDVDLGQDKDHGVKDPNSGSNTLYLTPGFRVRFDSHCSATVAPSFPVYEHLSGDQGRLEFKLAVTFSYAF